MKLTLCILPMGFSGLFWFLLLAIAYPGTVQGKVVDNFQPCQQFFKDGIAPQGFENSENRNSMVKICQMYQNAYHFATLYRTDLRIPVYSAYSYTNSNSGAKSCRPGRWFIEPQIESLSNDQNMQKVELESSENQALDSDYVRSGYHRGHLYPFSFNEGESATASCTLTNAVPERPAANSKWYHHAEKVMKGMAKECHNSGRRLYVVTGSADYNGTINNRVAIPRLVWTAACCCKVTGIQNDRFPAEELEANRNPQTANGDFSIAFMGTLIQDLRIVSVSLETLERALNVQIFNECKGATRKSNEEALCLLSPKVCSFSWCSNQITCAAASPAVCQSFRLVLLFVCLMYV